jgi:hypothetical protein
VWQRPQKLLLKIFSVRVECILLPLGNS